MEFTWIPDYGVSVEVTPNIRKAKFGDGYEQRSVLGINNKPREWSLTFTQLNNNLDDIEDFLSDLGGYTSFEWTPPRGLAGKWVCEEWSRSVPNPAYDDLKVKFREVFGE